MTEIAATVSELIEILQHYPGDWPLMAPDPEKNDHRSALHGIYIHEGEAHKIRDYFHEFYKRGYAPDEKPTIPALLLGDWGVPHENH